MSIFGGLGNEGLEKSQDRLGGGFGALDTDSYDLTIDVAYAIKSQEGAQGLVLVTKTDDNRHYTETLWVTNKKGENFFLNRNDPTKKVGLPGYVTANDICLVTTGKPLNEQADEEKIVNIYNFDQKKEIPTSVPVLTELTGKRFTAGILKILENKNQKNASTGKYEPIADTREVNSIDKVFEIDSKGTVLEAENEKPLGEFHKAWVERNKGNTRDKREIKDGGSAGTAGRPGASGPPTASTPAPTKSLFGNKG